LKWTDDPATGVRNWKECFDKNVEKSTDGKWDGLKSFVKSEGFSFLESAEKTFKCASVCTPGFFFLTQDLSEGQPERDCLSAFVADFPTQFRTPAMVALFTGIVLLGAFFCSFPLCSDYDEKNNMMDD